MASVKRLRKVTQMSNNHSAALTAAQMATSAGTATGTGSSFWRRLVDAWVRAYGNRVDSRGNIMCEL
jgi:hypothetical protein